MWPRIVTIAAAILLILHGLVHLVGTAAYACQINMKGFAKNAELLSGHLYVGDFGVRVFGWLWTLPALGFVAAGFALLAKWPSWKPLLIAVTLLSLILTVLDWSSAFVGGIIDGMILVLVVVSARRGSWFTW